MAFVIPRTLILGLLFCIQMGCPGDPLPPNPNLWGTSCVIISGGAAVRCWGSNSFGQLGHGHDDIGDNESPAIAGDVNLGLAPGVTVAQIAVGYLRTCALLTDGAVRCWGYNRDGLLGYGHTDTIGDDETPASAGNVNVGEVGETVRQIALGSAHTCALLTSGAVRCWGYNRDGPLGYGHTDDIGDDETPASAGNVNVGETVRQIALGHGHTCALLTGGAVRCWGSNYFGQLGYRHSNTIGDDETPASVGNVNVGGTVTQIALDDAHNCVLLVGGALRCWGSNATGQLGYGHTFKIGNNESPASAGDVNVGASVMQLWGWF